MPTIQIDTRSAERQALDEQIAAEELVHAPTLPAGATPRPIETYLPTKRPMAYAGIVENGRVRLLDDHVHLPEHSRVIIVTNQ